jgi:hypothetical protein
MPDETSFTVGPHEAVTDSRQLPAVTSEEEAGSVHGADLEDDHPDNRETDLEGVDAPQPDPGIVEDDVLPSEEELDLDPEVAGVDTELEGLAFDETDAEELEIALPDQPQGGGS